MKKMLKKSLALLLVLAMVLSLSLNSFAEDDNTSTTVPVTDVEAPPAEQNDNEEIVAAVSLMSCMYIVPITGHTWIYVENLSDTTQRVGLYDLPVGQGVSIGSLSISVSDGWGIYYNLEAYRENRDDNLDTHWAITKYVTQSELDDLSDHLSSYINSWGAIRSCSFFSFVIWNDVADSFLIPITFPMISHLEVMLAGATRGTLKMYSPGADQVFRQIGTGDDAYLSPVSQKTLDN